MQSACCLYVMALFSGLAIFWIVQSATTRLTYAMLFAILLIVSRHWKCPLQLRPAMNLLDKYSYTIYLVQGLVLDIIIDRHSMSKGMIAIVAIGVTFMSSVIIYNVIERPIQRILMSKRSIYNEANNPNSLL